MDERCLYPARTMRDDTGITPVACVSPAPTRAQLASAQRGTSLLEVLVGIVLVAIIVPALAAGTVTAARVGESNAGLVSASTAASGVAERVAQLPYLPCVTAGQLQSAYEAAPDRFLPPGTDVTIARVDQWSRSSASFQSTCEVVGGAVVDGGLQRVTVRATVGDTSSSAQMVLRDPNGRPR